MTTSINRASGSGSPSGSSRGSLSLQRGRACGNCRKRKIKCDGQRPVCSQCLKSARPGDACEYADAGRTRTQVLEENISRLEARIRELEEPFDENSVKLHSPYTTQSQGRSSSMPTLPPVVASSSEGISPTSTPATPSPPPSSVSHSDTAIQEEPPANVVRLLLQSFLPHAIEFGFFLNISRFQESVLRPLPLGHYARPAPALLSTVYLLGLHLSGSTGTEISNQESSFLSRALLHVANILSSTHPHRIIHGIQSEILLSTYFFRTGRILEGKYHLTAATSLTLGAGFHHIRSQTTGVSSSLNLLSVATPFLPAPSDQIEEGERINAFWTTFALCNTWTVAIGSPLSSVVFESHGSRIDTPWPLDMHEYEQVEFSCTWRTPFGRFSYCKVPQERLSPDLTSSSTVQNFLNQQPSTSSEYSTMAMYVKSSILLEKAGTVAGLYTPSMEVEEANRFAGAFASLDSFIDTFRSTLAPIEQTHISSPLFGTTLLTHTITHVATIHLHEPFVNENQRSQSKSLSAAEACVSLLRQIDINSLTQVNPLFGSLWTSVCKVLINEIQYKRALRAGWAGGVPVDTRQQENELAEELEKVFATMALFSLDSPLMNYQLAKIQELYQSSQM
ncbi:hypothetical protein K435DRAFT_825738 [Dendrothele bispora CBS 962.96]|uniref:Zn(2)-C6 fungal-type domain-containing protein n=1 Tax=Dendrothele bispora (strain CBS 962.96) TaxID=1314807 RepID=A0A4V4HIJ6_DENBC|nr:hypothetical protein K435DRAFT_825738 [Dendrothele bispora CBS 962.96]